MTGTSGTVTARGFRCPVLLGDGIGCHSLRLFQLTHFKVDASPFANNVIVISVE